MVPVRGFGAGARPGRSVLVGLQGGMSGHSVIFNDEEGMSREKFLAERNELWFIIGKVDSLPGDSSQWTSELVGYQLGVHFFQPASDNMKGSAKTMNLDRFGVGLVPKFIKKALASKIETLVKQEVETAVRESIASIPAAAAANSDVEILLKQIESIIECEQRIPPPPPKHLQVRVSGSYSPEFLRSGFWNCQDLNRLLQKGGKQLTDFSTILDFGCGCGRVLRALHTIAPAATVHGAEIDPEAVDWLNTHYSTFGQFSVLPHLPPTPYPDNHFDFVYGISVFTHLPEDMQFLWLEELCRITKPLGYLILTTHGEIFYKNLDGDAAKQMKSKGFYYVDLIHTPGLPDFYRTAYHAHAYIRRQWSKYFQVVDIEELGLTRFQDMTLLQKRNESNRTEK